MEVTWLPDVERRPRHLAVGEFDGVHAGHREVIRGSDSVMTFEPHPRTVVAPQSAPKLLTTLEQKADLIAALGVDELIVIPFDGERMSQTAQEFIDHELVGRLGAVQVSVGENFRFGHRARGDATLLAAQSAFGTRGIVAHGDKRGRTLGFPTANLVPDPALAVPDHGIYACRALVPGMGEWTAAVSIGVRPTFVTGRGLLVEAFLLDFEGDLYGRELRLQFVDRIRGEKRFDSVEALVEQMH